MNPHGAADEYAWSAEWRDHRASIAARLLGSPAWPDTPDDPEIARAVADILVSRELVDEPTDPSTITDAGRRLRTVLESIHRYSLASHA